MTMVNGVVACDGQGPRRSTAGVEDAYHVVPGKGG